MTDYLTLWSEGEGRVNCPPDGIWDPTFDYGTVEFRIEVPSYPGWSVGFVYHDDGSGRRSMAYVWMDLARDLFAVHRRYNGDNWQGSDEKFEYEPWVLRGEAIRFKATVAVGTIDISVDRRDAVTEALKDRWQLRSPISFCTDFPIPDAEPHWIHIRDIRITEVP